MQLARYFGKLESLAIEDSMEGCGQMLDEQILKGGLEFRGAGAKVNKGNDGLWDTDWRCRGADDAEGARGVVE
jgi:hypothetical protein